MEWCCHLSVLCYLQVNRVGVQVRAALITAIYGKALAVSTATMQAFTTGQVGGLFDCAP